MTAFNLQYNNRLGTLAQSDSSGNLIILRTNIGNSRTTGLELFLQGDIIFNQRSYLSVFTATSFMDARYQDAVIRSGNTNIDIDGNKVESVPAVISIFIPVFLGLGITGLITWYYIGHVNLITGFLVRGYDILISQTDQSTSFIRAARRDLAAAFDSLGCPDQSARFHSELGDTVPATRAAAP